MLIRLLFMAASLGGAALVGRKAIDHQIEKRLPVEIESARNIAVVELEKKISQVIAERLVSFTLSLLIKSGLVGSVYLLYAGGHLTSTGLKIVVSVLIFAFIVRDLSKTIPFVAPTLQLVRRHQWNLRKTVKEFVVGIAFERAYADAMIAMESGPNRMWLALSKYSAHNVSEDVAAAVADVARTTSFRQAKQRALLAALAAFAMMGAYIGFFFITVGHA